ncbi:hypothetical protein CHS0354_003565, partial [Potamilus streckersoni]
MCGIERTWPDPISFRNPGSNLDLAVPDGVLGLDPGRHHWREQTVDALPPASATGSY